MPGAGGCRQDDDTDADGTWFPPLSSDPSAQLIGTVSFAVECDDAHRKGGSQANFPTGLGARNQGARELCVFLLAYLIN